MNERRKRAEKMVAGGGFLVDGQAIAACVLWASGMFDTAEIASLLGVREDSVYRTLAMARETARRAE